MSHLSTKNYPSKENILARIPEIEIFRRYLGVQVDEKSYFRNPMRQDRRPTCIFIRKADGRLRMKDCAGYFEGDCIDLVMKLNNASYQKAIEIIWKDFKAGTITKLQSTEEVKKMQGYKAYKKTIFNVKIRPWDYENLSYWEEYCLGKITLEKFKVYPIDILWVGNKFDQNIRYRWDEEDPGYGYYFGDGEWKIYFPKRSSYRFLSNTSKIQGINQLINTSYIVITKSLKDVMCLDLFNIPAIAPQSESIVLRDIDQIVKYYKQTYVLFDNDWPGMRSIIKYKYHGAIPLMFPRSYLKDYGIKDFSDYLKKYKVQKAKQLINEITSKRRAES